MSEKHVVVCDDCGKEEPLQRELDDPYNAFSAVAHTTHFVYPKGWRFVGAIADPQKLLCPECSGADALRRVELAR